jgi:DNA-binding MarR family transcriptional regulator
MNELSRRMMVTGGNVTGITDQLVRRAGGAGRGEGDRRAYRVRLTPKGRALFKRHGGCPRAMDCLRVWTP